MKNILLLTFVLFSCLSIGQVKPDVPVRNPQDIPVKNPQSQNQTRRTTNSSIGIGIDLGGLIRSIKRNKNCNQVEIIFPSNKTKFIADKTIPPIFRWKSSKTDLVVGYKIELVQIINKEKIILYQGETKETQFSWPEEVAWRGASAGKLKYEFFVMAIVSNGEKCGNDVSGVEFTVTTENPVIADTVVDNTTKKTGGGGFEAEYSGVIAPTQQANQNGIIALTPRNGASYQIGNLPDFTWRTTRMIEGANYKLEVFEVLPGNKLERIQIEENLGDTPMLSASRCACKKLADHLVSLRVGTTKDSQPRGGNYMWKVTETKTGISSNPSYFSVSSCDVDLQISNETIECLGYEGANRKYKICFSSTYQSRTGDLTYNNAGSGLFVYDQNNSTIAATLVGSNMSLQTQMGSTSSTVNYCFEVLVPAGVTSIGFGLQGDDLDPTPVTCQPGASLNFDTLPNCLCDACDGVQADISNFTTSTQSNSINLSGSITANVPVYGIEVQVVSYAFNAQPGGCTAGVTDLEHSGMILLGQSSINNNTQLQAYNLIGIPNNTNATKAVRYTTGSPVSGSIPISLDMGLPMPLTGLDASCCTINYRVCLQFKIYTDRGICKSCAFEKCIDFTN